MRNNKGQFIKTTGSTRYKKVQYKGKTMGEHCKVWIMSNGEIPEGYIIHHINHNKKDNRLGNLQCMTIDAHNKHHCCGRITWNKGIKAPQISKSKMGHNVSEEQIEKVKETWKNKYLPSMEKIYKMRQEGKTNKQISKELNLSKDTVAHRLMTYKRKYLSGVNQSE